MNSEERLTRLMAFVAIFLGWFIILGTIVLIIINFNTPINDMPWYVYVMTVISFVVVWIGIKIHMQPLPIYDPECVHGGKDGSD